MSFAVNSFFINHYEKLIINCNTTTSELLAKLVRVRAGPTKDSFRRPRFEHGDFGLVSSGTSKVRARLPVSFYQHYLPCTVCVRSLVPPHRPLAHGGGQNKKNN